MLGSGSGVVIICGMLRLSLCSSSGSAACSISAGASAFLQLPEDQSRKHGPAPQRRASMKTEKTGADLLLQQLTSGSSI